MRVKLLEKRRIEEPLEECQYDRLPKADVFIKLLLPNDFYFLVKNERRMKLECGKSVENMTLRNSGIVHLERNCRMYDEEVIMKSRHLLNLRERYGLLKNIVVPIASDRELQQTTKKRRTIDGDTDLMDKYVNEFRVDEIREKLLKERNTTIFREIGSNKMIIGCIGLVLGAAVGVGVWWKCYRDWDAFVVTENFVKEVPYSVNALNAIKRTALPYKQKIDTRVDTEQEAASGSTERMFLTISPRKK